MLDPAGSHEREDVSDRSGQRPLDVRQLEEA